MKPTQRLEDAVKGNGRTRELGPIELHERTVLAAARRVEQLSRRSRELARDLKRTKAALRAARREFRVLLQNKPDVTLEQLELAGQADAADRARALAENRTGADFDSSSRRGLAEQFVDGLAEAERK